MRDFSEFREFCLTLPGAKEDMPFGPGALVFKVGGKIFALTNPDADPLWFNLKCDPFLATELRDRYPAVRPGYHMNKRHWNTVMLDGSLPDSEIRSMIGHSYDLVFRNLTKKARENL